MVVDFGWSELKVFIEHASGIERSTLHVVLGVVVQFAVALLLRVPATRWAPWLTVLALELVNECSEFAEEQWPDPGMQFGEAFQDVLLTMLLPTLILFVGRFAPGLLVEHPPGHRARRSR
jgi:hypothetical protein